MDNTWAFLLIAILAVLVGLNANSIYELQNKQQCSTNTTQEYLT